MIELRHVFHPMYMGETFFRERPESLRFSFGCPFKLRKTRRASLNKASILHGFGLHYTLPPSSGAGSQDGRGRLFESPGGSDLSRLGEWVGEAWEMGGKLKSPKASWLSGSRSGPLYFGAFCPGLLGLNHFLPTKSGFPC